VRFPSQDRICKKAILLHHDFYIDRARREGYSRLKPENQVTYAVLVGAVEL
jgi:hypothetical protein